MKTLRLLFSNQIEKCSTPMYSIIFTYQISKNEKKNEHLLALTGRRNLNLTVLHNSCVFSLTEAKCALLQIVCELPLVQAVLQRLQEYRGARGVGTECPT